MNFKKRFYLILVCYILVIGVIIVGIIIGKRGFSPETPQDSLYLNYIVKTLVETIEDENGIMDCKIDVNYSNGEIVSVNVSVVAENDEINISEISILDYISQSLGISTEDIVLSFE